MRDPSTQVTIVQFQVHFLSASPHGLHQAVLKDTLYVAPHMRAC